MSSLKDKKSSRTDGDAIAAAAPGEVVIGRIVSVGDDGAPVVDFAGNPAGEPVRAMATARYADVSPGASVALMFVEGDRARPLAIGVVSQPEAAPAAMPEERLTFSATREIVLQCGRASLVLTRAGKVLVRGAYVSLRSSGMQRITGASVQIN
jgi:Domain of unknown function (DUF6484)